MADLKEISNEGYRACAEGKKLENNPWSQRDYQAAYFAWRSGWLDYWKEEQYFSVHEGPLYKGLPLYV